jgi:hypothetical protein
MIRFQTFHRFVTYFTAQSVAHNLVTDLINALPGNSSVNTGQYATIHEAVFYVLSAPSRGRTTGLCNPLLDTGLCYESGDVINNRGSILRGVCAECL